MAALLLYLYLHVLREIELKVKLPSTDTIRQISILVKEGEAKLDDFQQVHIAPVTNIVIELLGEERRQRDT